MKYILLILLLFNLSSAAQPLPAKTYLPAPFLCQAPQGNWSQPWQDACEEATLWMAMKYVGVVQRDSSTGGQEILKLVAFQKKAQGGHFDLSAKQTAQLIKDYYHYNSVSVRYDVSIADIKQELVKGNLVVAPMAGQLLNNPSFTPPGPVGKRTSHCDHKGDVCC